MKPAAKPKQSLFEEKVFMLLSAPGDARAYVVEKAVRDYFEGSKALSGKEIRILLRIALNDSYHQVRYAATEAIGDFGNSRDVQAVVDRLDDPEWLVRASACGALPSLAKKRIPKRLQESLFDPDPVVRRYAAVALFDIGGPKVRQLLEDAAKLETDDLAMVGFVSALAHLGDETARVKLKEYAASDDRHLWSPARESLKELEKRHEEASDRTGAGRT